ncbi:MAG: transposase, partial [Longicatena sp.]
LKRSCNRRDLYEMLLTINEDFTLAYQLKESYRKFNAEATPDNAEEWLTILINSFTSSNLHIYFDFISLLNHWKPEIINSFKRPYGSHKLSNAYTENVNGKIRSYLAVSNGTSNFDRFRKKIIYALNDKIFYSLTQTLHSCKRKSKPRGLYNK